MGYLSGRTSIHQHVSAHPIGILSLNCLLGDGLKPMEGADGVTIGWAFPTDCESSIAPKLGMALRLYWDRRERWKGKGGKRGRGI